MAAPFRCAEIAVRYPYHAHVRDYRLQDGVYTSVPIGEGLVDFLPVLAELQRMAVDRDRFVLAIEMDLDDGDEHAAVRDCARYMADWLANAS